MLLLNASCTARDTGSKEHTPQEGNGWSSLLRIVTSLADMQLWSPQSIRTS